VWSILGVTSFTLAWAAIAQIEQAILVQGKLEPQGVVKDVQSPMNGVVRKLYVKEGQVVKQGELLLQLDSTAAEAQIQSLQTIQAALQQENQFYKALLQNPRVPVPSTVALSKAEQLANLASLAESRVALIAESQVYQAELKGGDEDSLNAEQRQRLRLSQTELNSRTATSELEVAQLQEQLNQAQTQMAGIQKILTTNQDIERDLNPLYQEGGLARLQYRRQQQEVMKGETELQRLTQEAARLKAAIKQAREKLQNTIDLSRKDVAAKIADNQKSIAAIDSQFSKVMVENQKRLAEVESQMSQAKLTVRYQDLRAPVSGIVFDLKAHAPDYVATLGQPVLKIVPKDNLIAKVFVTNQDIGFVREGMAVDVRIDSFPFSEFGDIKGKITAIGSDALPPEPIRPFYSFPAKVEMNAQVLQVEGRSIPLQSGMSVSANLKLRKRTVLSLLTDLFTRKAETLKFFK
jgi:HlyD family secretion protein